MRLSLRANCGWLFLAWLAAAIGLAGAQGDKVPPIKEIMGKLNKGASALTPTLKTELQAGEPEWAEIQKQTKQYAALAAALGKNVPPRGDKDSWSQLAQAYADNAKALENAAEKKDKTAALVVHKKLTDACMVCHKAHRK